MTKITSESDRLSILEAAINEKDSSGIEAALSQLPDFKALQEITQSRLLAVILQIPDDINVKVIGVLGSDVPKAPTEIKLSPLPAEQVQNAISPFVKKYQDMLDISAEEAADFIEEMRNIGQSSPKYKAIFRRFLNYRTPENAERMDRATITSYRTYSRHEKKFTREILAEYGQAGKLCGDLTILTSFVHHGQFPFAFLET